MLPLYIQAQGYSYHYSKFYHLLIPILGLSVVVAHYHENGCNEIKDAMVYDGNDNLGPLRRASNLCLSLYILSIVEIK